MNPLRARLRLGLLESVARDVCLDEVRHNERPVYVAEGYGGQPIECFPPFRFYRLFHDGRADEARAGFAAWYVEQFRKYASVPKSLGGMQNGTLHRLLRSLAGDEGGAAPAPGAVGEDLLRRAAALRVEQRLALFEGIRDLGYQLGRTTPVLAVRRNGHVYLTGGHHRAAALAVLGQRELPHVSIFRAPVLGALKGLRVV